MDTIKIDLKVHIQRIQDLLCDAFEGGSNYWCEIVSFNYPEGQTKESLNIDFQHLELPFKENCSLTIRDKDSAKENMILNLSTITEGLQIMADRFPTHFADFMRENDDGNTADVFLQCCLFKDVIYG